MSTMTLPVLSGAENTPALWPEFTKHITSGTAENPRKGSLGVHFDLADNLVNLYSECDYDMARLKTKLRENGRDTNQITQLCQFLDIAENNQNLFFIKQESRPRWLVKRVGHYRFDPTKHYPHRISYEYVRDATAEECLSVTRLGRHTIEYMNCLTNE